MAIRGEYIIKDGPIVRNTIIEEGAVAMFDAIFNADDKVGHSFIIGAFAEVPAYGAALAAQYATEPVVGTNGYARISEPASGWTVATQNGEVYVESPDLTFTAAGGDFTQSINRFFMAISVESPVGVYTQTLLSVSSALNAFVALTDTQSKVLRYRMYLK